MRWTDVVVAAVAAAGFVGLTVLVLIGWQPLVDLDRSVSGGANRFAAEHPDWVRGLKILTMVAGPLTWRLLMLAFAVWLLVRRATGAAAFAFAVVVTGGVLSTAVKVAVDRARPEVAHPYANAAGMAFPSGHASTAALACGTLLLLALPGLTGWRRAPAWAAAVAIPVAIGGTRIGLDVHWTSDVLGGWLLGVAVVAAAHAVIRPAPVRAVNSSVGRSEGQRFGSSPVSR